MQRACSPAARMVGPYLKKKRKTLVVSYLRVPFQPQEIKSEVKYYGYVYTCEKKSASPQSRHHVTISLLSLQMVQNITNVTQARASEKDDGQHEVEHVISTPLKNMSRRFLDLRFQHLLPAPRAAIPRTHPSLYRGDGSTAPGLRTLPALKTPYLICKLTN